MGPGIIKRLLSLPSVKQQDDEDPPPREGLPSFAIGTANLGLTSGDLDTLLFGLAKTVSLFERDLMLRTDIRQIDNEDRWLASAGFLYMLHENVAFESWLSQVSEGGPTSVTLKLDFILRF